MAIDRLGITRDFTNFVALQNLELAASEKYKDVGYDPSNWAVNKLETFKKYSSEGKLWVAHEQSNPLGFALLDFFDSSAHLEELDVHPDSMGLGIGTNLMRAIIEFSQKSNKVNLSLRTFSTTPWSVNLYSKFGFVKIQEGSLLYLKLHVENEIKHGLPMCDRITMNLRL